MRNLTNALLRSRTRVRFAMLVAGLCLLSALPLSSVAAPPLTITVVNNSNLEIRHLYLAPANTDNWGPDLLGQSPINAGATRTLNVSWDQSTVKLVGEDQDGCFLTATVGATSSATWTISSNATRDCN
jgi:hypothetical protein